MSKYKSYSTYTSCTCVNVVQCGKQRLLDSPSPLRDFSNDSGVLGDVDRPVPLDS